MNGMKRKKKCCVGRYSSTIIGIEEYWICYPFNMLRLEDGCDFYCEDVSESKKFKKPVIWATGFFSLSCFFSVLK